jgi:hypothetical protein
MAATDINTKIAQQDHFKITDLGLFLSRTVSNALIIAGLLALGFLIWGAVNWIMSQGDKTKVEEARNRITAAVAGLALIALVYLIWRLTLYFLGIGKTAEGVNIFELY